MLTYVKLLLEIVVVKFQIFSLSFDDKNNTKFLIKIFQCYPYILNKEKIKQLFSIYYLK